SPVNPSRIKYLEPSLFLLICVICGICGCSSNLSSTFRGAAYVNLRCKSGSLRITLGDSLLKLLHVFRVDEIDCAATKSTSGHPGPVNALNLSSKLNHYI